MINLEHFKYTIVINQRALSSLAPNIHFEDAAVFNYIQCMCKEENERIASRRLDGYTWITYKKIIQDMPLLKGKTEASVGAKIKKLADSGLIKVKTVNANGRQKKYFLIPDNIALLVEKNGDTLYYKWLLSIGMNEAQASEVAADNEFLRIKKRPINKAFKDGEIENPAGYIWQAYLYYTEREFPY